ncbi:MAG: hypothetical protein IKO07_13980 [Clostridia bacterium]|nr:hypothetical protein [Clostridia bacterium]
MSGQPGLILYLEDLAALEKLPDSQYKAFVCGLYHYALEGAAPAFDDVTLDALFVLFRAKIDRDATKYSRQVAQRREASAQRWKSDRMRPHPTASECIQTESESVKESGTEVQSSLSPPSLSEIEAEIRRAGLQIDAARFLADCEGEGWKDSRGEPVRDWRKWLRGYAALTRAGTLRREEKTPTALAFDQRRYSEEELRAITDKNMAEALARIEGG